MAFGAGKPKKLPSIDNVRVLTPADIASVESNRGVAPPVKKLRDSHHMLARLCAIGLKTGEIAARSGYSSTRISILRGDPSFQELVASYRKDIDASWREGVDEYFETISSNRTIAARLINDKLNDADPDEISFGELVKIHSDAADRTGYPKRTVAVNVNVDFAARLEQAIKRSGKTQAKMIEAQPTVEAYEPAPIEHDDPDLRRRA